MLSRMLKAWRVGRERWSNNHDNGQVRGKRRSGENKDEDDNDDGNDDGDGDGGGGDGSGGGGGGGSGGGGGNSGGNSGGVMHHFHHLCPATMVWWDHLATNTGRIFHTTAESVRVARGLSGGVRS